MRKRSGKSVKSKCNGQATVQIPRSTRFTLLLLLHHHILEALSDCTLTACDAMPRRRAYQTAGPSPEGGQWCPAPHLKSVPPISRFAPRLLHTSNTVFENMCPPSGVWPLHLIFGLPAAKSWRWACQRDSGFFSFNPSYSIIAFIHEFWILRCLCLGHTRLPNTRILTSNSDTAGTPFFLVGSFINTNFQVLILSSISNQSWKSFHLSPSSTALDHSTYSEVSTIPKQSFFLFNSSYSFPVSELKQQFPITSLSARLLLMCSWSIIF